MDARCPPDRRRYDPAAVTSLVLAVAGVAVIASFGLRSIALIWSAVVILVIASWLLVPARLLWTFIASVSRW